MSEIHPMSMMVAIYPDERFLHSVSPFASQEQLDNGLHVTLFDLGRPPLEDESRICEALHKAVTPCLPLNMYNNGPGLFVNHDNQFLVKKLTMNAVGLDVLRYRIVSELWKIGIKEDHNYGFSAHLTLDYIQGLEVPEDWEQCGLKKHPRFEVSHIHLVRCNDLIESFQLGGRS